MNTAEHISSGLLESYVLGLTSVEENLFVQNLMKHDPQIKEEIIAIEESLMEHAQRETKILPLRIKQSILNEIESSPSNKIIKHPAAIASNQTSDSVRWLAAASIALLIFSTAVNFYLYNHWKNAEQKITALNNEKVQLANQLNVEKTNYQSVVASLSMIQSPYNKPVMMKGMTAAPDGLAMVYWNMQTHEVFVNIHHLPAPPEGKQYQLWALADGKPIDAGVFVVTDSMHVQKMKVIESAQAFAVTLEKIGGSAVPTLSAMYLMGQI